MKTVAGALLALLPVLLGLFACGGAIACVASFRLSSYLRVHRFDRWKELSSVRGFGFGAANPIGALKYLKTREAEDDENVLRYKHRIRAAIRISLSAFAGATALLVVAMILGRWS